jgi:hypothetical protein
MMSIFPVIFFTAWTVDYNSYKKDKRLSEKYGRELRTQGLVFNFAPEEGEDRLLAGYYVYQLIRYHDDFMYFKTFKAFL